MPFARLEPKLDQCMSNSTLNRETDTMAWEFQTGFPVNASPSEIDKNDSHEMSQQVHITKTDHKNSGQDTKRTGIIVILLPKDTKLLVNGKTICQN